MDSDERLAGFRKEIDETDAALNELFHKRMRTAEKIAEAKAESRAPAEDRDREKEVIEKAVSAADIDLKKETESFFRTLISFSKIRQSEKRGLSGTFGELPFSSEDSVISAGWTSENGSQSRKAAEAMFAGSVFMPYDSCDGVIEAVKHNEIGRGVFKADNSPGSPAVQIYSLLEVSSCFVTDEVYTEESLSSDSPGKKTGIAGGSMPHESRHIAAAAHLVCREDCDTVLASLCVPETAGALNAVLQIFILCGIDIKRIEPGKDSQDGSTYYVQLHADYRDENIRCMLAHAAAQCAGFRILGCYTAEK